MQFKPRNTRNTLNKSKAKAWITPGRNFSHQKMSNNEKENEALPLCFRVVCVFRRYFNCKDVWVLGRDEKRRSLTFQVQYFGTV